MRDICNKSVIEALVLILFSQREKANSADKVLRQRPGELDVNRKEIFSIIIHSLQIFIHYTTQNAMCKIFLPLVVFVGEHGIGAAHSVDSGGHYSARISRTLAAGVKSADI